MTSAATNNPANDPPTRAADDPRAGEARSERMELPSSSPLIHRFGRAHLWAALSGGVFILLLGGAAWYWQAKSLGRSADMAEANVATASEEMLTIKPQAVSAQLDIAGTIATGRLIAVVAPFDGVIREKRVQLGDHVEVGSVVVVMDTSEIAARYRDAQSAYLKAAMAAQTIDKWEIGTDVLRSRRALDAAQNALDALERQVSGLKDLLDQGIISRNEYDGVVQQRDAQRNSLASTKDDLAATLERGNSDNRQLAALDLENTRSRLLDLKAQMAGAEIATAIAGILIRPPLAANGQQQASIEPGASVTRGTALFSVADTSNFTVTGVVDEVDVNRVKIGQPAMIVSDAFPGKTISGKIVSVSAEASVGRNGANASSFEVRASFKPDDESLRQAIRIGMSARMTVETYANPAALIVPPTSVVDTGSGPQVRIRRDGKDLTAPVLLGGSFPQGVEIISGLKVDDEVRLSR